MCGVRCGKFGLDVNAREASAFEASKRVLAETTYVDMARVDLNTLEIGSLSLPERNREFQSEIGSYAAVMVFALLGVKSCKSCLDLSARKVTGKLRDVSFWYANLRMAETCTVSMAVSETSHMSHDVFFPCCCKGTECSAQCSDDWPERQSGLYAHEVREACKTVSPAERVQVGFLVVGVSSGSRDVIYPSPKVGLLGERPAVSGGREKTQREELQCRAGSDTAKGPVVKTVRVLLVLSLGEGKRSFDDRGKSEASLPSSRDHGHPEVRRLHGKSNRRSR